MKREAFDILVPISLEQDNPTREELVAILTEQNERYGIKTFMLNSPAPSWRSSHYPPREAFVRCAELFREVKEAVAPLGIRCGWWVGATLKSGPSPDFVRMTRFDGSDSPFANCPLDPNFVRTFSENVAAFAEIAHPALIMTEDDFSIHAAAYKYGCFCRYHLAEFSRREGKEYTREELVERFERGDNEGIELLRRWRELMRDSLVGIARATRAALDRKTPEIPMGYMQAGNADTDGDVTEAVARAFAGERHIPFSRIYGAFYNGVDKKRIASQLFHALYSRQHIGEPFGFIHESDTFPHTRFFTAAADMRAMMGTAYSYGFKGSIHQTAQLLDAPNEEKVYGDTVRREILRYKKVSAIAEKTETFGARITYDPFYNTLPSEVTRLPDERKVPWSEVLSRLSIPFTTVDSPVVFLDAIAAKYYPKEELENIFKGLVFVDGNAAAELTKRGLTDYIGVSVIPEEVVSGSLVFDLGARDVITPKFRTEGCGKHMPATHMFSNGGCGKLYRLDRLYSGTEPISELYTYDEKFVATTMTLFENPLGGHAVVMGMTISANNSQSLYNYRRMRLWQGLIVKYADSLVFPKEHPHISVIMNKAKNETREGFYGMLTLTNLQSDPVESPELHLPPEWREKKCIKRVSRQGRLLPVSYESTSDGIRLSLTLEHLDPVYLVFSK